MPQLLHKICKTKFLLPVMPVKKDKQQSHTSNFNEVNDVFVTAKPRHNKEGNNNGNSLHFTA